MRFLAIDYGERRLGLAVCDPDETLASPHGTREREGAKCDIAALVDAVRGLGIEAIVFGLPRGLDPGKSDENETKVRKFAGKLQSKLQAAGRDIPIEFWDERFSTREALAGMRAAGVSQRQGREGGSGGVDARAAAVILQGFLDHRRARQGNPGGSEANSTPAAAGGTNEESGSSTEL